MKKTPSLAKLRKEADRVFSRWIRARDKGKCYTCRYTHRDPYKLQCGHFIPRQHLATRYDEVNCHAQCFACNMFYAGQSGAYAVRLDVDFGAGTVARLEAKRHVITKWSAQDYLDIIERYKEKPLI